MTTTLDLFGPIVSLATLGDAIATDLRAWMPEYLAALERQTDGAVPGETPALRSVEVRHAAVWRSEEQVPAAVVWIAGVQDHTEDPDGVMTGTVEMGVALFVGGRDLRALTPLIHRYAAATRTLLMDRPTAGGECQRLELVDEDFTGIDVQTRDRVLASAEIRYHAHGVRLGQRNAGPGAGDLPRPDPVPPWPPVPTVLAADTTATPTRHPADPEP